MKTPTDYCRHVEARLGWTPPDAPAYRRYQGMARRVKDRIATDPELYTWRNLQLAVELLVRERKPRNPLGVFAHVPRAVAMAVETESDVELAIREAIATEAQRGDPDDWTTRFTRAHGPYRAQALAEWRGANLT